MITSVKRSLLPICACSSILALSGCSSIMAHVGPYEGYYAGTSNDAEMIADSDNGWMMRSMLMVDLPFTALLDTVLLPYDYYRSTNSRKSPREILSTSEKDKNAKGLLKGSGHPKSNTKAKAKAKN
ncbi:YceK/YidQ family lipoprotein [Budvicia diplopodorum]|uniref:YceK/YidQ family lipoprotein n=1 Tax=Budvicia diplopodorum TaxID=1119056 RepID=UPI00135821D7|nr:YceK/YidQ family lipoprotein [Budvicia diplopodorum]